MNIQFLYHSLLPQKPIGFLYNEKSFNKKYQSAAPYHPCLAEKETAENFKRAKGLASHFKSSIEKDRKYFAYELHEELARLAAAVKLDINWVSKNTPGLTGIAKERIEHVVEVSELLIKKFQRISFSVSPNMLDYFGLKDTLEWLCHDFSVLNETPLQLQRQLL